MKAKMWLPIALWLGASSAALAGSATATLPIAVRPLSLSSGITAVAADCSWPQGFVIATWSALGGNGNPITWTLTGDTTDFALSSTTGQTTNIVVKPASGITPAVCGTTVNVTATATQ